MKKLFFFLAFTALVAMANAQWVETKTIHTYVPGTANFFNYTGTLANDSVSLVANPINRVIDLRRAVGLMEYAITTTITKSAGTPEDYRFTLDGSMDATNWTRLKTYLTTNTATEALQFTSVDTLTHVVPYAYLRVRVIGDGETTSRCYVSNISGKVLPHFPPK